MALSQTDPHTGTESRFSAVYVEILTCYISYSAEGKKKKTAFQYYKAL